MSGITVNGLAHSVLSSSFFLRRYAKYLSQLGGGRAPYCISRFGQGHVYNRGATHFTLERRPCIISYYKYACAPLSKLSNCAPPTFIAFIALFIDCGVRVEKETS